GCFIFMSARCSRSPAALRTGASASTEPHSRQSSARAPTIWRIASTMFWPCDTRTSTCRNFATISSGLYRSLAIAVLLDVKDIPQVGPLQRGLINLVKVIRVATRQGGLVGWGGAKSLPTPASQKACANFVKNSNVWVLAKALDQSPSSLGAVTHQV